jgi:DNA-directed RNA polymerase specialized sigma24 family protein
VSQKTLYEKYKKIVKEHIRCKYSSYLDIDDDVSEIMIKVIMGIDSFDTTKGKFKSWVLSIIKHHMVDKWRDNSITLTSFNNNVCVTSIPAHNWDTNWSGTGVLTTNSTGDWSPDSIVLNNGSFSVGNSITTCSNGSFDNCSSVNFISAQISPADYALLDMKYVQGYNYCEIGQEFNLTSGTVSNKVNYIKTKLKKEFSGMMEE